MIFKVITVPLLEMSRIQYSDLLQFAEQVAQLEREKADLQRDVVALQNEGSERHSTTQRDESPEFSAEKQQVLADMIQQKNKHISELLNDVEVGRCTTSQTVSGYRMISQQFRKLFHFSLIIFLCITKH